MRHDYNARYVRLYSWCEGDEKYLNDVIKAAYLVGLGVYTTIWFGFVCFGVDNAFPCSLLSRFDGGDTWESRRDLLVNVIHNNALSRYVVRFVDVESKPLFDWVRNVVRTLIIVDHRAKVLEPQALADEIQ
jgi:hypothetical protein